MIWSDFITILLDYLCRLIFNANSYEAWSRLEASHWLDTRFPHHNLGLTLSSFV